MSANGTAARLLAWRPTIAGASIAASVAFIVLLGLLHVLRPELDPSWHFISDYEAGPWGWVMRLAFYSLGASCLGVVVAVFPHAPGIVGRLGLLLLLVSAGGLLLAGLFAPSATSTLHETGAMLDQLPFAGLFLSISLWRNPAWRSVRWTLAWALLVLWAGAAVFIWAMVVMQPSKDRPPSPDVLIGWPSRVFILAHCAWLIPVAWWSRRLSAAPANSPARCAQLPRCDPGIWSK
ncbi:MAG: DUF998 domain-containing protein [Phycisphaerae bacterium]|jgi:hypothetical membrane protein|nr:DUF998 domain-containing protein [Phycisphaerae bacterium]MCZ2400392.1 DUF998 domain-containing protein [Phycisphaerae bacterium]